MLQQTLGRLILLSLPILFSATCRQNRHGLDDPYVTPAIEVSTDKGFYQAGEKVELNFAFSNRDNELLTARYITAEIRYISSTPEAVVAQKTLIDLLKLTPGNKIQDTDPSFWQIPNESAWGAYGIYIHYELEGGQKKSKYVGFFRVVADTVLTTYRIDHHQYKGVDVFALHGGMSAESIVGKSAENLKPGIAHSWHLNAPGSGPEHVLATPQFLQKSVQQTVDFYNETLGEATTFQTVIIGPGIQTNAYLSNALKAPVLPIHFLASANTVKEIQSILDYSNHNGYPSYATLGHDYSVPFAVAWVKLLDLPQEYIEFLKQHRVKNLVFAGYMGDEGENMAKKVSNGATQSLYAPGSLFILYPGGGSAGDLEQLNEKILDYSTTAQPASYVHIADWESGLLTDQVSRFTMQAREQAGITNAKLITSSAMIHLWDLATYVSAAFLHKNQATFSAVNGTAVKGVSLNPYFSANAFFESWAGYLPLIYWQLNPKEHTASRLKQIVESALSKYFPATALTDLNCWVNASNNFDGANSASQFKNSLLPLGFKTLIENDFTQDDVWNEADGMHSPIETRAVQMANSGLSAAGFKTFSDQLIALSMSDLDEIQAKFPEIIISTIQ